MVEPLRRVAVSHRARELDASVGVEQLGPHDPHVVLLGRGVLQAHKPARARLHVRVEHHHVARRVGDAQAAVHVGCEAFVALPRDDVDALDARQLGEVLAAARVVGDDHAHHPLGHGAPDRGHERLHPLGISEAGDHDVDRPAVFAIPRHRPAKSVVAPVRAQAQAALQRCDAQRERDDPEQQRSPAQVAVGQIHATAQGRERAEGLAVGSVDRGAQVVTSGCASGSKLARPSSDSLRLSSAGSRSARDPSVAPARRATW